MDNSFIISSDLGIIEHHSNFTFEKEARGFTKNEISK